VQELVCLNLMSWMGQALWQMAMPQVCGWGDLILGLEWGGAARLEGDGNEADVFVQSEIEFHLWGVRRVVIGTGSVFSALPLTFILTNTPAPLLFYSPLPHPSAVLCFTEGTNAKENKVCHAPIVHVYACSMLSRKNSKQQPGSSKEVKPVDQWINSSLVNAPGLTHLAIHTTNLHTTTDLDDATINSEVNQILEDGDHLLDLLQPHKSQPDTLWDVDVDPDEEGGSVVSSLQSCGLLYFNADPYFPTNLM